MLVAAVPVHDAVDRVVDRHPVDVVFDDALLLRHPEDLRLRPASSEDARVVGLAAAVRVEEGLVEDDEVRPSLGHRAVELPRITWIRLLSAAFFHVEDARRHAPRKGGPPYRIRFP